MISLVLDHALRKHLDLGVGAYCATLENPIATDYVDHMLLSTVTAEREGAHSLRGTGEGSAMVSMMIGKRSTFTTVDTRLLCWEETFRAGKMPRQVSQSIKCPRSSTIRMRTSAMMGTASRVSAYIPSSFASFHDSACALTPPLSCTAPYPRRVLPELNNPRLHHCRCHCNAQYVRLYYSR